MNVAKTSSIKNILYLVGRCYYLFRFEYYYIDNLRRLWGIYVHFIIVSYFSFSSKWTELYREGGRSRDF